MKSNFGIRFMLRSIMSFCLALLTLGFQIKTFSNTDYFAEPISEASVTFTVLLILLGYYRGLNTILRTRVSPEFYLVYVLIGICLAASTILCGLVLFSMIDDVGYVPIEILAWTVLTPIIIAFLPPFLMYRLQALKENPIYRQWFLEGKGGSAIWASVGTFNSLKGKLKQKMLGHWLDKVGIVTEGVYLGRTLMDDDPFRRHVVIKDDAHMMTVGSTGSGKGTTVLFQNLSMGEWSCIINDTKGELCRLTANRRHHKNIGGKGTTKKHLPNGQVYILDPFGVNQKFGYQSNSYAFLNEIDPKAPNARQLIAAISDGCFYSRKCRK